EFEVELPAGSVLPEGTVLDGVTYSGANRTLTDSLVVKVRGINELHALGYNFSSSDPFGLPFFTNADGSTINITAANIQLNQVIADNPAMIATSMRLDGSDVVVRGNNSLAVLFSQLRDSRFNFGTEDNPDPNTVDAYFRSIVGELGVQS